MPMMPVPLYDSALNTFITLLVILDPPGLIPIFLGLTGDMNQDERSQTALIASLISLGILILFALVGLPILSTLGISLGAFRIAGGILLFCIAFEMIFEKRSERKGKTVKVAITRDHIRNIAAFPLALPLIAGPGTISATILMASNHQNLHGTIANLSIITGAILICYLFLKLASPIEKLIGATGRSIVTRLFGVLLAALAVQFVGDGLSALFSRSVQS